MITIINLIRKLLYYLYPLIYNRLLQAGDLIMFPQLLAHRNNYGI